MMHTIESLLQAYREGLDPKAYLLECLNKAKGQNENKAWISLIDEAILNAYLAKLPKEIPSESSKDYPLYGVPFAIKDNIDLADLPTTAACPGFSYQPKESAFVVQQLMAAGAIPLGKTNMDQFATGLVGTRSPYGQCQNSIDPEYISGGSSSGSAVAVALDQVLFSLGTDTAGSGRVPAALNEIWGLKPSRGRLSCTGVVPACKSLDCVSIFARSSEDLEVLVQVANVYDEEDIYAVDYNEFSEPVKSKLRIGIPQKTDLEFFGNTQYEDAFYAAVKKLKELTSADLEVVEIDYSCFKETAEILYGGPWVAERFVAMEKYLESSPQDLDPTVSSIVLASENLKTSDAYKAFYKLESLRKKAHKVFTKCDVILTPTIGTLFTRKEIDKNPIIHNSQLGFYTNHMNLLNMCGLAMPAGRIMHPKNPDGFLPFGVTLHAMGGEDLVILRLAREICEKI